MVELEREREREQMPCRNQRSASGVGIGALKIGRLFTFLFSIRNISLNSMVCRSRQERRRGLSGQSNKNYVLPRQDLQKREFAQIACLREVLIKISMRCWMEKRKKVYFRRLSSIARNHLGTSPIFRGIHGGIESIFGKLFF